MVKIVWTQRSLTDLKSIAEYISKDSAKYAALTLERIIDVTKHIETNPRIGRMVPEIGSFVAALLNFCSCSLDRFVMIYTATARVHANITCVP